MYVCEDCGSRFTDPETWEESHGWTHGPFEQWHLCPFCGSAWWKDDEEEGENDG